MSNAAREGTHCFHFLGLTQLGFGAVSPLLSVIALKVANEQLGKRVQKIFFFVTKRFTERERALLGTRNSHRTLAKTCREIHGLLPKCFLPLPCRNLDVAVCDTDLAALRINQGFRDKSRELCQHTSIQWSVSQQSCGKVQHPQFFHAVSQAAS